MTRGLPRPRRVSMGWRPVRGRVAAASLLSAALGVLCLPGITLAHSLGGRVSSPLPLAAYLGGAAVAVGLSFFFVAISDPGPPRDPAPDASGRTPRWLRLALRAVGLVAWLWIVVQAVLGGSSDADVSYLFLWLYGWVGLAVVSALVGPAWSWLDPFSTLHDLGAGLLRRLGIAGLEVRPYPNRLGIWPAIAGFCFFIWVELVARVNGGPLLGFIVIGYTLVTLVGMAQFGKEAWRRQGETFSVWFGLLGRLAPFRLVGEPEEGRVHRRPFASGLVSEPWTADRVVLVALGTASILYDGASQTRPFFDLFGFPDLLVGTLLLGAFLAALSAVVLAVSRSVGLAAMGAGLVPVALGYLIAHYFTALATDGQRIVVALSDPFQQGWNLFGGVGFEPNAAWLPTGVVWGLQVAAVVLGHVVGAWAGHAAARWAPAVAARQGAGAARLGGAAGQGAGAARLGGAAGQGAGAARLGGAAVGEGRAGGQKPAEAGRGAVEGMAPASQELSRARSQLPLALLMICLTSATLWSLGQNIVFAPEG
ncbi:MAG: hypothetical protein QOH61_1886 [Chloroflexota bacterium]|nr:hypothetical protein [Chloroflexota bacterium]